MIDLDIRDVSIINAFPHIGNTKECLNVGCGKGRIDYHLVNMGYTVYATDYTYDSDWEKVPEVFFHVSDIFDLNSFPVKNCYTVICSETLEHLVDYKEALNNLLILTTNRLIITVPYKKSFDAPGAPPVGHCNYWDDKESTGFKDIYEFYKLCYPYSVSISKIRTKPKDVQMNQWCYLIVVDKEQKYG